jgi:hypothetical protein
VSRRPGGWFEPTQRHNVVLGILPFLSQIRGAPDNNRSAGGGVFAVQILRRLGWGLRRQRLALTSNPKSLSE